MIVTTGALSADGAYLPGLFGEGALSFTQTLTIRNTGAAPQRGPISIALRDLSPGVQVVNATRTTPDGTPFLTFDLGADNVLSVGESATVTVRFASTVFAFTSTPTLILP